jgi:FixJ family two-component response regulator
MARRILGADDPSPVGHTIANPHGLTRRERDVLELIAAGHSDAEIAAAYAQQQARKSHRVDGRAGGELNQGDE